MKMSATYQKLRGGYYTPEPIANFLSEWAITSKLCSILEPCCGDGVFLESSAKTLINLGATKQEAGKLLNGIEIDAAEALSAYDRVRGLGFYASKAQIQSGDFFAYCRDLLNKGVHFDAIVGNPPFIRYQNFPEEQRSIAFGIMESAGLHPNRLTNAWVPFVVGSTLLLESKKGRLAMVIPAELLQVNYAAESRHFLSDYYSKITLMTFRKLIFGDIQQEVVLFLGERNGHERTGIRTFELDGVQDLQGYEHTAFSDSEIKPLDHSTEKWTQYFLSSEETLLLRELRANPKLNHASDLIEVDVGVVTGQNDFFVLTKDRAEELEVVEQCIPLVSRSAHLVGILFDEKAWRENVQNGYPALLLNLPSASREKLAKSVQTYVSYGESMEWHMGYKCRIRNPWYAVPSVWTPGGFMMRQIHNYPKLVLNATDATCTDTIHRVKFKPGVNKTAVAIGFLNTLTFAFAEVIGRSYGGGVLELEPKECEKLPIPMFGAEKLDLTEIHQLVANGDMERVLEITDKVLLRDGLGLNQRQIQALRDIWIKLRDRRNGRKRN
jgi:adenine-specific DNA-methyltransferase